MKREFKNIRIETPIHNFIAGCLVLFVAGGWTAMLIGC